MIRAGYLAAMTALAAASASQATYVNGYLPVLSAAGSDVVETGPAADISNAYFSEDSRLDHYQGSISYAYLSDTATEVLRSGQSWLFAKDRSGVLLDSSAARLSWLVLDDDAKATVTDGTLSWAVVGGRSDFTIDFTSDPRLSVLWLAGNEGRITVRGFGLSIVDDAIHGRNAAGADFSIRSTYRPCRFEAGCDSQPLDLARYAKLNLIELGDSGPPGVPEPSSWAMLLAGFLLGGTALRRSRMLSPNRSGA